MSQTIFTNPTVSGNFILNNLDPAEYQKQFRFFRVVDLAAQQTLYAPGDEINYAYFPVSAVAVVVSMMQDGSTVETAMMGREGLVGIGTLVGSYAARYWTKVLLAGEALRVEGGHLRETFEENPQWQRLLLNYYGKLINQISRRTICNTRHRLLERFCTWLLMLQDRAGTNDLPLTQETAARQLGVRRAGINECVGRLESLNIVQHRRGHIYIVGRELLEDAACVCYNGFREESGLWEKLDPARAGGVGDNFSLRPRNNVRIANLASENSTLELIKH